MVEKKPKVLLVANVAKEHVLKFHVPTIKRLAEMGWKIDVACSGDEEVPYCSKQYKMSYKRSPFNFSLFKGIYELKHIIDRENYDIVYCHTPVGGLAGRIASIVARKRGTKVIYFAHGYHFFKTAPKMNWLLYYTMEKLLSYVTDAIILINKEDFVLTKKKFKSCKAYLINGIGIDFSRFSNGKSTEIRNLYREELNIPSDAIVLIYLAELIENKNQTLLLDALKEVHNTNQNVYLVLAGIDHCNGKMQEYAETLQLTKYVRFLGWRDDIDKLYMMSDICTASSIREGFGLNLVEAMYCKLPIVASANRGHRTIIHDGKNGFLVPLDNAEMFADRINLLIEDVDLREKFIRLNSKIIHRYDSAEIVDELVNILKENL